MPADLGIATKLRQEQSKAQEAKVLEDGILSHPITEKTDPFLERHVREIAAHINWGRQRKEFKKLVREN